MRFSLEKICNSSVNGWLGVICRGTENLFGRDWRGRTKLHWALRLYKRQLSTSLRSTRDLMLSVTESPRWLSIGALWFHWGSPSWEYFSLTGEKQWPWSSTQVMGRLSRIMLDISSGTCVMLTCALFHFTVTIAATQAIETKMTCTAAPLCCYL